MPSGLQCFNSQGVIIVDLTDKQLTLFKKMTIAEALGGQSISSYFGTTDIGAELTLQGIHPDNTVAYLADKQIGTATNMVHAFVDVPILITGPNKYRMACMETRPQETTNIVFYKFR